MYTIKSTREREIYTHKVINLPTKKKEKKYYVPMI